MRDDSKARDLTESIAPTRNFENKAADDHRFPLTEISDGPQFVWFATLHLHKFGDANSPNGLKEKNVVV
jgi:hypothetical protein